MRCRVDPGTKRYAASEVPASVPEKRDPVRRARGAGHGGGGGADSRIAPQALARQLWAYWKAFGWEREQFNVDKGHWSMFRASPAALVATMPPGLWGHSLEVVRPTGNGESLVVILGGSDVLPSTFDPLNHVAPVLMSTAWIGLIPEAEGSYLRWSTATAIGPAPRVGHVSLTWERTQMYIFGGSSSASLPTSLGMLNYSVADAYADTLLGDTWYATFGDGGSGMQWTRVATEEPDLGACAAAGIAAKLPRSFAGSTVVDGFWVRGHRSRAPACP